MLNLFWWVDLCYWCIQYIKSDQLRFWSNEYIYNISFYCMCVSSKILESVVKPAWRNLVKPQADVPRIYTQMDIWNQFVPHILWNSYETQLKFMRLLERKQLHDNYNQTWTESQYFTFGPTLCYLIQMIPGQSDTLASPSDMQSHRYSTWP